MFGALRRCPATLSKNFSAATIASRSLRAPLSHPVSPLRLSTLRLGNASVASFHHSTKWQQIAAEAQADSVPAEQSEPITDFKDLQRQGLVHHNVIDTIVNQMRLKTMTDVQIRTINEALSGVDVIAQAKTGTGKTLGFLIPIIQRIIESDPKLGEKVRGYSRTKPDDIRAIVISPTRELAEQIAVEARKVVSKTGIVIQVAVGGTQKRAMLQKTQREGCHILIGTPGRINDIFSDPYSGVKAPKLNALVMDEADRLLDDGFTREIDEIKTYLPDPEEVERQNLMFSATIPRDVVDLVRKTMRPGFHFAKCVSEDEEPTHERIPQHFVDVAGFENIMPSLYELVLKQHEASRAGETRPFKAIIYFNSTAEVTLAASVFFKLSGGFKRNTPLSGLRGYEIHAKLSQAQRTRAADDFRHCNSGVMFSSDVTARGMDFPNVTHVVQVGLPRDRDTYIHRLGRTGRAGKEGEGWIFITPFERSELRKRLRGLPLADATAQLETASIDMSQAAEVPEQVGKILTDVVDAHKKVYPDQLDAAFRGLFGSYQWLGDKRGLLEGANRLAEFGWGMPTPPQPPSSFFSSMGSGRRSGGGRSGGGRSFGGGNDRGSFGGRDRGSFGGGRDRNGFGGGRSDSYGSRQGGFNERRGSDRGGERRFNNDRNGDRGFGGDRPRREARLEF